MTYLIGAILSFYLLMLSLNFCIRGYEMGRFSLFDAFNIVISSVTIGFFMWRGVLA